MLASKILEKIFFGLIFKRYFYWFNNGINFIEMAQTSMTTGTLFLGFAAIIAMTMTGSANAAHAQQHQASSTNAKVQVEQFGMVQCPMTSSWFNMFWKVDNTFHNSSLFHITYHSPTFHATPHHSLSVLLDGRLGHPRDHHLSRAFCRGEKRRQSDKHDVELKLPRAEGDHRR